MVCAAPAMGFCSADDRAWEASVSAPDATGTGCDVFMQVSTHGSESLFRGIGAIDVRCVK
jgi:hypothetical protein